MVYWLKKRITFGNLSAGTSKRRCFYLQLQAVILRCHNFSHNLYVDVSNQFSQSGHNFFKWCLSDFGVKLKIPDRDWLESRPAQSLHHCCHSTNMTLSLVTKPVRVLFRAQWAVSRLYRRGNSAQPRHSCSLNVTFVLRSRHSGANVLPRENVWLADVCSDRLVACKHTDINTTVTHAD